MSFVGCFNWVTNSPQETIKGRRRSCAVASRDWPALQAILGAGAAMSSSKPGAVQATFRAFCLDLALVLQLLFWSSAAIDPRNSNIKKKNILRRLDRGGAYSASIRVIVGHIDPSTICDGLNRFRGARWAQPTSLQYRHCWELIPRWNLTPKAGKLCTKPFYGPSYGIVLQWQSF